MPRKQQEAAVAVPAKADKSQSPQICVISLKGTQAYRDWLRGFHKQTHISPTTLFRLAMADLSEKYGYELPPEK